MKSRSTAIIVGILILVGVIFALNQSPEIVPEDTIIIDNTGDIGTSEIDNIIEPVIETPSQSGISLFFPIYEKLDKTKAENLASKYDLLIMHSINKEFIRDMKRVNPKIVLLEYKSFFMCNGADSADTTVEGYYTINSNWFVTSGGQRIGDNAAKYSVCEMLDVKNPDVINYMKNQYVKEVKEDGFDGLFMDALSLEPVGNYANSIDQYTDNVAWQKSLLPYLNSIYSEFKSNNKLFVVNAVELETIEHYNDFAGSGSATKQLFDVTDGGLDEVYLMGKWQDGVVYYRDPTRAIDQQKYASEHNKYFLAYAQIENCNKVDLDFVFKKYVEISNSRQYLNPTCSAHHTYNIAINNYETVKPYLGV